MIKCKHRWHGEAEKTEGASSFTGTWVHKGEVTHVEIKKELVELAVPIQFTEVTKKHQSSYSTSATGICSHGFGGMRTATCEVDGQTYGAGGKWDAPSAIRRMMDALARGIGTALRYDKPHPLRQFLGVPVAEVVPG